MMCTANTVGEIKARGASKRARSRGFTLIELMVVVAIVAILAGVAFASYQDQVTRSRRSAGANCLQERAQFLERYYTTQLTYVGATVSQCDNEVSPHYAVTLTNLGAKTFTLTATPQGAQATKDNAKCGALTLDARGTRGKSGSSTVADCW